MNILKSIALLTIGISTLISCGDRTKESAKAKSTEAIQVKVLAVKAENKKSLVHASGVLQAIKSASLSTRFMGNIAQVKVKTGEKVEKGDLLMVINSEDLQAKRAQANASIRQAEAAFENAKKDYERFQKLHKKGSASDKEFENMKSRFKMSEAGLAAAQGMKREVEAQFDYLNIKAPFKGTIMNLFKKEGDIASPGFPLVSIEALDHMEAQLMVSEGDINQIKKGQKAMVDMKSIGKEVKAEVSEVSFSSKNTGGQYIVKLTLDKSDPSLLPGMFVNAAIIVDSSMTKGNIFLPNSAFVENGQLKGVYIFSENDNAILRWVRIGKQYENRTEVLSGIRNGDKVIINTNSRLYNGATITL